MTTDQAWMCQACKHNPVPALGEQLCADCATTDSVGDDRTADVIDSARALLAESEKASRITSGQMHRAIALALQGILVCQIESLTRLGEAAEPFMMPAGTIMLPDPEPEIGPKPWGQ